MLDSVPIGSEPGSGPQFTQHDILALLLEMTGHPSADIDHPLSVPEVTTILRDKNELLTGLTEERITAFIEIFTRNAALRSASAVGRFHGDLLYFRAAHDTPVNGSAEETWRSLVSGRIETHDIACTHNAMTQPAPLAHIGQVLASHLDAIRDSPGNGHQSVR
ncbi:MAG TPA: hypothetical protein VFO16_23265 [Pseudonocardiaceae bacterium]|nr:hypothetical protein [Pseudonocardiaceae bacterium]